MRQLIRSAFLAASVIAATCAGAAIRRDPADGRLMPPEKVAPHIWVMRQPDRLWAAVIGNVEIFEQTKGVVLMDSGGSIADGRQVVDAVRRLTGKPIVAVAITHWHNDHPLGIPAVLQAFPHARVVATPATAEYMKTELKTGVGKRDLALEAARRKTAADTFKAFIQESQNPSNSAELRRQYAIEARWIAARVKRQMGNYVVLPTETVADRLVLSDPLTPVDLRFLGVGNTHGDLIAWMPRQKVVATGDIVVLPTPYGFEDSIPPWRAVLGRLQQLPFTTLIPGHGKVQYNRRYLQTLTWSMNEIERQARAFSKAGLTKDKAWAKFDKHAQERRFGARDDWTRKWLSDYWLQGMFETAYGETKGIPAGAK